MKNIVARATKLNSGACYGEELIAIVRNRFAHAICDSINAMKVDEFFVSFYVTDNEPQKPDAGCFHFFDKFDLTDLKTVVKIKA